MVVEASMHFELARERYQRNAELGQTLRMWLLSSLGEKCRIGVR